MTYLPAGSDKKIRKILVTRNDRVGDLVLATPVFRSLRGHFPTAHVAVLVRYQLREILQGNPYIDEIIWDDVQGAHRSYSGFLKLVERIAERHFDTALILLSDFRMGLLTYLAGIPRRIGSAKKIAQIFYTERLVMYHPRSQRHEVDHNLDLLQALGVKPIRKLGLWVKERAHREIEHYLKQLHLPKGTPLIGIHPVSGGSCANWKISNYAHLINRLREELNAAIIVTYAPWEEKLVREMKATTRQEFFGYCSSNGLQELAALISHLSVFISSSTGPMHIAAALGIPTVSLFSPIIACSPARWGPIGNQSIILQPEVAPCVTCRHKKCSFYDCMDLITINSVLQAVKKNSGIKRFSL